MHVGYELAITNLVSNKRELNTFLLNSGLEIIAKFYRFLILQNGGNFMWQKQQQVGLPQNIQLLDGFFGRRELLMLAGLDLRVFVSQNRDRGKTKSSSVGVRDFCSLPVLAYRCRTLSSSVHWKLVSFRFLVLVRRECCTVFLRSLQML